MNVVSHFLRRFRNVFLAGFVFGTVPWAVTCIYIPLTGGPTGNDLVAWRLIAWIFRIFAPMEPVFVEILPFDLVEVSSHTDWGYHYLSWSAFAVLNVGFWILVFGAVKLTKERLLVFFQRRSE